jgi:hypothetical protein
MIAPIAFQSHKREVLNTYLVHKNRHYPIENDTKRNVFESEQCVICIKHIFMGFPQALNEISGKVEQHEDNIPDPVCKMIVGLYVRG